jgi:hypothetical protein
MRARAARLASDPLKGCVVLAGQTGVPDHKTFDQTAMLRASGRRATSVAELGEPDGVVARYVVLAPADIGLRGITRERAPIR